MIDEVLIGELIRDEGLKTKPYKDSEGVWTIGVGRNLEARKEDPSKFANGVSRETAKQWLEQDVSVSVTELDRAMPWWRDLNPVRQRALVNMHFNLGLPKLKQFEKTLEALKTGNFDQAANEALNSNWAKQVGDRAKRISEMFRTGLTQ